MSGLNGSLDGIVSELTELLGRAEWTQQQAQEALDHANAEVRRIKAILRAANPEPKAEPKPPAQKPKGISDETRRVMIEAIQAYIASGERVIEDVPHSFTPVSLLPFAASVHESSVRTSIHLFREEGLIRACGLVPNSPRQAPMAYVLEVSHEQ